MTPKKIELFLRILINNDNDDSGGGGGGGGGSDAPDDRMGAHQYSARREFTM